MALNPTVAEVTDRIVERSAALRRPYLARMARARAAVNDVIYDSRLKTITMAGS